jgi:uncharacterized protein YbaR (Trm112 family)
MFIELVDVLRCPRAHEKIWLVLAARRVDDRDVMEGTLGCPVCKAEYPIVDGVAHFDGGTPRLTAAAAAPPEDDALRLAALLDLADPRGFAVLVGQTAAYGPLIATMTDVQLLLVDPPAGIRMGLGLSGLTTPPNAAMFPLAAGSARAVALDSSAGSEQVHAAVDLLRAGGRLVAPASIDVPEGLTELARDEQVFVAERAAASTVVQLSRKR